MAASFCGHRSTRNTGRVILRLHVTCKLSPSRRADGRIRHVAFNATRSAAREASALHSAEINSKTMPIDTGFQITTYYYCALDRQGVLPGEKNRQDNPLLPQSRRTCTRLTTRTCHYTPRLRIMLRINTHGIDCSRSSIYGTFLYFAGLSSSWGFCFPLRHADVLLRRTTYTCSQMCTFHVRCQD